MPAIGPGKPCNDECHFEKERGDLRGGWSIDQIIKTINRLGYSISFRAIMPPRNSNSNDSQMLAMICTSVDTLSHAPTDAITKIKNEER
jgi:hypothetical protein